MDKYKVAIVDDDEVALENHIVNWERMHASF